MNLETERLQLTEIDWSDVQDIHEMNSFAEVDEFNTLGIPKDIVETKEMLSMVIENRGASKRSKYGWAVRLKASHDFAGEIGLNLWPDKWQMGEVFYSFTPNHWGSGYALESVKRVIQFGFNQLELHRIEAGVATENARSIRLLEKLGMTREGRRRAILPIRGEWKDNYHYAILNVDGKG